MAYRRRFRRKYGKRRRFRFKKKARRNRMAVARIRQVSGMPDVLKTRLRYSEQINLSSATIQTQTFALNGAYDPNITGVGHQPNGFDQFMNFYLEYEVKASKLIMLCSNNSIVEYTIVAYPGTDSTAVSSSAAASEQPYSRQRIIADHRGNNRLTFSNYMGVRKLEGRTTASVNFVGTASSNPAATRYWHIVAEPQDNTETLNAYLRVQIIYYIKFFKRKNLGLS